MSRHHPGAAEGIRPDGSRHAIDPDAAWTAVLERDPSSDGRLYYAVRTTGVYCRPVCPSRRPLRENVRFFRSPDEAEAAGFRPCRRCRPEGVAKTARAAAVERARRHLDENADRTVTLEELGRVAHVSPHHLQRTFKRVVGLSPLEYLHARRAERLKESLRAGASVSRATYEAGYGSNGRLYEHADEHLGMTPATYREGGQGARIRYAVAPCRLGLVLVAATGRGVCAISLGEREDELLAGLEEEYPEAGIEPGGEGLRWIVDRVLAHLEGSESSLDLPLDVRATAFQMRVWKALKEIPRGATASYAEVAAAIGAPGSARAVAGACAANRVALAIPCHRVVRADGSVSGYRWGAERKRALLEGERTDPG